MTTATPDSTQALSEGVPAIPRGRTGRRILFVLLFYVAMRVASALLAALVIFELLYTLVVQTAPPVRVRQLANRTLTYLYESMRYVSYNRLDAPFPFEDLPPELEPIPSTDALEDDEPYGDHEDDEDADA